MRVIIVRHGKAERESKSGRDAHRELRGRGRRQAAHLGEHFSGEEERPARIVASTATRALQTAEIIALELGADVELEDGLLVNEDIDEAIGVIQAHQDADPLMLVGHNMQLEDLVNHLLGPSQGFGHLSTGEAAILELSPDDLDDAGGCATLVERVRLNEDD